MLAAHRQRLGPRAQVIVFTADAHTAREAAERGADGVVGKPFDLEALIAAVRGTAAPPSPLDGVPVTQIAQATVAAAAAVGGQGQRLRAQSGRALKRTERAREVLEAQRRRAAED